MHTPLVPIATGIKIFCFGDLSSGNPFHAYPADPTVISLLIEPSHSSSTSLSPSLYLLERRTIMDLQYNIRTKLLHLDTTFMDLVVTDWFQKSIIALSAAESWWKNDYAERCS